MSSVLALAISCVVYSLTFVLVSSVLALAISCVVYSVTFVLVSR